MDILREQMIQKCPGGELHCGVCVSGDGRDQAPCHSSHVAVGITVTMTTSSQAQLIAVSGRQ